MRGGLVGLGASLGRISSASAPIVLAAVIAVLSESMAFVPAVRWTIVGTAVGCTLVGLASLVVAKVSPPVEPDADERRSDASSA